jgi:acetyltransferase-like isoleucine patch superfamily enzyme
MQSKLVIGCEPWLSMAVDDWRCVDPSLKLTAIEIKLDESYKFDLTNLNQDLSEEVTAFVAWGPEFLNFQRFELMGELKKHGFRMPALIHPSAVVSPSAKFQENVWVQALVVVGCNANVEINSCLEVGVRIGPHCEISKSVWISQNTRLAAFVKVGSNTTLGSNLEVLQGVRIGKQCCIESVLRICEDFADKSFRLHASDLAGVIIN